MSSNDVGFIERTEYNQAAATASMRNVPRFGRSEDFADLFTGKSEATSYVVGLLFAAILVFSIFFTWTVILLIFKCLGQKRVGFLSGSPFAASSHRSFLCRLFFVLAAFLFVDFSILFVTEGLTNLRTSATTIVQSARNVNTAMTMVDKVLKSVREIGNDSTVVRDTLLTTLANGGKQCLVEQELSEGSNNTGRSIAELVANLTDLLTNLGNFQPDEMEEFVNSTEYYIESAANVEDSVDNVEIGDWQSLVILIPYILTPVLLVIGVVLAYMEIDIPILRCMLTWVVHPIFIFQVVFAYILSSTILISASANADFCSGGEENIPDRTVLSIMANLGWTSEDLVYVIMVFYVGQCTSESPFEFLDKYRSAILEANALIFQFSDVVTAAGTAALSETCETNVTIVEAANSVVLTNLDKLLSGVQEIQDLLRCSNIVRLYTDPVYDGTCIYSINGFTWAWASFVAVAAMGLIMIMLRSAWQLDVDDEVYGHDMTTIHGEFTVDQRLGGEDDTTVGGYVPYGKHKGDDNVSDEQASAMDEDIDDTSDHQDGMSYDEAAYSVGSIVDGGQSDRYDDKPPAQY